MKKHLETIVEETGPGLRLRGCESGMVLGGTDRDTIAACQRGEPEAFRALFEAHRDRVYSIALRYSGDPATAMDVAQDTFVRLMAKIGDYRGEASFETWLYRLVVNSCLDRHRRAARWVPFAGPVIDALQAAGESVVDTLLRRETRDSVQAAVAKLPADQRIVVVLRYTEGLSYDEIGEVLGCAKGTVGSRLNRAHQTLGKKLAHLKETGHDA